MTRSDMTDLLDALYATFASGDASSWEENMSDDVVCIGTDEAEWWHGREALLPTLHAQIAAMSAAGISVVGGEPVVVEHGDVVWAADRPTMTQPDGSALTLRATIVAVRAGGRLVIQQLHLSAPAPNEDVVQMELPV